MASSDNSPTLEAPLRARGAEKITTDPAPRFASHEELRIGEIVLAAAALEPDERASFLRQATVSEPELLEEARRRLAQAADLPKAFLAVPAAELLEATTLAQQSPPARPPLAVGAQRYELGECLGHGGMARVYKAFDRQLQRPVALKLLERADPTTLRRFLREAQAQARVRHEYVLEVYETGDLGGQPYIAMHYVDGPTLMEIRGRTSLEQKIRLMAQVAEGLHAAHREGLIHRDVKPGNVLVEVTPDGKLKPWVADFGIATELGGGSSMWSATLAGTPSYIAPERLFDDQPVDRRSDIYSLGVTVYQLLCGEVPFDHPSLGEMLRQVREEPPRSLRELLPTVPAEIEAIVMKCLAKDPDDRYRSARAVAEDLWRFLDGERVEAHTASFTYRLARPKVRKRFALAVAGVATALLIALLAALAWTASNRATRAANEAVTALDSLAAERHAQGRYEEAAEHYQRALALRQEHLGAEHLGVAQVLIDFAALEAARGDFAAGERKSRRALGMLSEAPEADTRRAQAGTILGACLTGLGRYDEAEAQLLDSYRSVRDPNGAPAAQALALVDRLVDLYEAWGRIEEAAEFRRLRRPDAAGDNPDR